MGVTSGTEVFAGGVEGFGVGAVLSISVLAMVDVDAPRSDPCALSVAALTLLELGVVVALRTAMDEETAAALTASVISHLVAGSTVNSRAGRATQAVGVVTASLRVCLFLGFSQSDVKSVVMESESESMGSCLILFAGQLAFPSTAFAAAFLLRLGWIEGFLPKRIDQCKPLRMCKNMRSSVPESFVAFQSGYLAVANASAFQDASHRRNSLN